MNQTKIAVLSNVNMNFVIRSLKKEFLVYDSEGYGNELGVLMNPASSYHEFAPKITFLVMDLMEVIGHDLEMETGYAEQAVEKWFSSLESCLKPEQTYYVSDAYLWGQELLVAADPDVKRTVEAIWQEQLIRICKTHSNVHVLPYCRVIETLGEENAFSLKMWYLGKILHTNEAQKRLGSLIAEKAALHAKVAKKVLLLDLDNTLWGGLAGEADHTPVILSDDHAGLAYKNLQRVILQMQRQGVLLGIVSKNNEEDAMAILEKHPHCVLRPELFAVRKINWEPKHENIMAIAEELNLGLDSFVFFDDNPTERELVASMLPQVTVPQFPAKPEELAGAMVSLYKEYFEKEALTKEDLEKTKQYADNARRNDLQAKAVSFEAYLKQLDIVVEKMDPQNNIVRLVQLVNKTNQFNLTTCRYEHNQMQQLLEDPKKRVYLYRVADCFGDSGIVAAAIVDVQAVPMIEEFVMSCRVMGKNIEYAIIEEIEDSLQAEGFGCVQALYLPTAKNKPVEQLYEKAGYTVLFARPDGSKKYEIDLANRPHRVYDVTMKS